MRVAGLNMHRARLHEAIKRLATVCLKVKQRYERNKKYLGMLEFCYKQGEKLC